MIQHISYNNSNINSNNNSRQLNNNSIIIPQTIVQSQSLNNTNTNMNFNCKQSTMIKHKSTNLSTLDNKYQHNKYKYR